MDRFARFRLAVMTGSVTLLAGAAGATEVSSRQIDRKPADWSGEARVQQATGLIKPSAAPVVPPATKPNGPSPTAPITCNDQNAASQACYTATQQSRPVTR